VKTSKPHRKRVKYYDDPGHVPESTFSCYRRMRLLTNDDGWRRLARGIDRACEKHTFHLAAFVFMPGHVRLLVWPQAPAAPIGPLLQGNEGNRSPPGGRFSLIPGGQVDVFGQRESARSS